MNDSIAAEPPVRRPPWGPLMAFLGILLALAINVFASVIVFLVNPEISDGALEVVIGPIFAISLIAIPFVLTAGRHHWTTAAEALGFRRFRFWPALGQVVLFLVIFIFFTAAWYQLVQPETQDVLELVRGERGLGERIVLGVTIMVLAPIGEEVFFRGFMFGALRGRMAFWAAALISGAIFGLAHVPGGDIAIAVPLTLFGFLLAYLYERTGSILPPILLHMSLNTLSFIVNSTN